MKRYLSSCITGVSILAALGCNSDETVEHEGPDCTGSTLTLTITEPSPDSRVTGDVMVRGSVSQSAGLAVHYVRVAGVDVTKRGFNFETWETNLTFASLKSIDPVSPTIVVEAEDTCEYKSVINVPIQLAVPVTGVAPSVTYPNGKFAPATKPIPATITISASPASKGGTVSIAEPPGWSIAGLQGGQVTLNGNGTNPATALLLATCSPSAVDVLAQLTVVANEMSASTYLRCVGPPTLNATSLSLVQGGAPVVVEVRSGGDVAGCQATSVPGVNAASGGLDLTAGNTVQDTTGDGNPDFKVSADASAAVGAKITVACWDSYLQTTKAVFEVVAP